MEVFSFNKLLCEELLIRITNRYLPSWQTPGLGPQKMCDDPVLENELRELTCIV